MTGSAFTGTCIGPDGDTESTWCVTHESYWDPGQPVCARASTPGTAVAV